MPAQTRIPPERDVHLHVYEPDRPDVRDHLDLHDWLRSVPTDRTLYGVTKQRLAQQQWTDMHAYADAKTEVSQDIWSEPEPGPGAAGDSLRPWMSTLLA